MRTIFSKICLTMFLDKCWCWWNFGICPRMSVFTFDSVQASNKRTKFNLNPTEKANVLVHIFDNCLAHILLSSEYTLNRILIAQESFKIILCICSKDSLGFFLSKKSWGCPSVGKLVACFSLASRLQYSIYRASSARTYQVQKQVGPIWQKT